MHRFAVLVIVSWVIIAGTSCGNIKNFQYLQGAYDTATISKIKVPEPLIKKDDLLEIKVYSDDPIATAAVTNPAAIVTLAARNAGGGGSTGNAQAQSGYLVDQQGRLQIFKLGLIPAAGKTKKQLADTLTGIYEKMGLLKNPYV